MIKKNGCFWGLVCFFGPVTLLGLAFEVRHLSENSVLFRSETTECENFFVKKKKDKSRLRFKKTLVTPGPRKTVKFPEVI